jgi:hypothetical protein
MSHRLHPACHSGCSLQRVQERSRRGIDVSASLALPGEQLFFDVVAFLFTWCRFGGMCLDHECGV